MAHFNELVPRKVHELAKRMRSRILSWSVQRPFLSIGIVVLVAVSLLPIVTAATLMPIALFLKYSGVLASHGIFYITYNIFAQGAFLGMVIVALFITAFFLVTSASVLHSYRVFKTSFFVVKKQQ